MISSKQKLSFIIDKNNHSNQNSRNSQYGPAFTIVELLVVIVVIAILAVITIISYSGIREKAVVATIQSDLSNAKTQLETYKIDHEVYPTSISDCPTPTAGNICLKLSNGNSIASYSANNSVNPPTYSLTISNTSTSLAYKITESTQATVAVSGWKEISAGDYHTCAIASNDKVYCWGRNDYGQLGNNSTTNSSVPVAVNTAGVLSDKIIKSISIGDYHTCAFASDNQTYCWGRNNYGQLGNNSTTNSLVPVAVNTSGVLSGKTIKAIEAGYFHTCTIASDNNAYCWGFNYYGELGNNSTTDSLVPVAVNTSGVLSGKTIKAMSASHDHTCAIASDNNAYCWGGNTYGLLGNNSTVDSLVPIAVYTSGALSGKTIKSISTGRDYTCAIASDNNAYCWGYNASGQLGNNSTTDSSVPIAVYTSGILSGKTIKSISTSRSNTCAVASDDNVYCWGRNDYGQLGNNNTTNSSIPVAVYTSGLLSGKTIKSISSVGYNTCAIASDNNAYCWGYNNYGQFGNNSTTNSLVPIAVITP